MAKLKPLIDDDDEAFDSFSMANTGAVQFAKMIPCALIAFDPAFQELFSFDDNLCSQIAESIKKSGYDQSHPIQVWVKNDGTTVLIDGHHRLEATKRVGLAEIPCVEMRFDSTKDALLYAYAQQLDRRNLDDESLLTAIDTFIKLGGKHVNRDVIAAKVGVSARTVSKVQAVLKDDEATQEVKENGKSINAAYNDLLERKHPEKKKHETDDENSPSAISASTDTDDTASDLDAFDDISESLSDTGGDPKGIVIGDHSDHIERPDNRLSAEEDTERTRERHRAFELGYTDGFVRAADYIFAEFFRGTPVKGIYEKIFCIQKPDYERYNHYRHDNWNPEFPDDLTAYDDFRRQFPTDYNPRPVGTAGTEGAQPESTGDGGITPDIDFGEEEQ